VESLTSLPTISEERDFAERRGSVIEVPPVVRSSSAFNIEICTPAKIKNATETSENESSYSKHAQCIKKTGCVVITILALLSTHFIYNQLRNG
jgi:hypothetical protein